jgi:hypothetical protein
MSGRGKCIACAGEQFSFLPPVPFCPTWPNKHNNEDRAIKFLSDGRRINTTDFHGDISSSRLAADIDRLVNLGWPIEDIPTLSLYARIPNRSISLYESRAKYIAKELAGGAHP